MDAYIIGTGSALMTAVIRYSITKNKIVNSREIEQAKAQLGRLVFRPARKWTPSRAGFASGCVVVLDGRQPVCVLRLTGHKSHSELKSTFSPDGTLGFEIDMRQM